MNVILFGSLLNPLSAETAQYLYRHNMLRLVVIAGSRGNGKSGFVHMFSQICIGLYRYFHVLLRRLHLKRSINYNSLLEFIVENFPIPMVSMQANSGEFEKILESRLNELSVKECVGLSCIFPFKISLNSSRIKKFVNIHPGELPLNRGPNPYFWALVNRKGKSGITYHILTPQLDAGPILFQELFHVGPDISEYRLEKITAQYLRKSLPCFFEKFEKVWPEAKSQGKGIFFSQPSMSDRRKYKRHSLFHVKDLINR